MKEKNDFSIEEASNWNSAKSYSDIKIMNPSELADKFENIAQFGFPTYEESLKNSGMDKLKVNYLKFRGFEFLVACLIQLTHNSEFAIKISKVEFAEYLRKLKIIEEKLIPILGKKVSDGRFTLNPNYPIVLNLVKDIKAGLNLPLNQNNLIFMNRKEFDPKEAKKKYIEEATERG
jgi:hypothetical protein